jgi:hypothetical protein
MALAVEGKNYAKALACFGKAALCLESQGAPTNSKKFFAWSYNMYQGLRRHAGFSVPHVFDNKTYLLVEYGGRLASSKSGQDSGRFFSSDTSVLNEFADDDDTLSSSGTIKLKPFNQDDKDSLMGALAAVTAVNIGKRCSSYNCWHIYSMCSVESGARMLANMPLL